MYVPKSSYCHEIFVFSELLDNLVLIKHGVKKPMNCFQKEEKEVFSLELENSAWQGLKLPLFLS